MRRRKSWWRWLAALVVAGVLYIGGFVVLGLSGEMVGTDAVDRGVARCLCFCKHRRVHAIAGVVYWPVLRVLGMRLVPYDEIPSLGV